MKNQRLKERKQELKDLAKEIKSLKPKRKGAPNGYVSGLGYAQREYRFKHIAYCMARGTSYDKIESKTREPIWEYYWTKIEEDIEFLKGGFDEDVRVSA